MPIEEVQRVPRQPKYELYRGIRRSEYVRIGGERHVRKGSGGPDEGGYRRAGRHVTVRLRRT